jgi:hypothetical protein
MLEESVSKMLSKVVDAVVLLVVSSFVSLVNTLSLMKTVPCSPIPSVSESKCESTVDKELSSSSLVTEIKSMTTGCRMQLHSAIVDLLLWYVFVAACICCGMHHRVERGRARGERRGPRSGSKREHEPPMLITQLLMLITQLLMLITQLLMLITQLLMLITQLLM